MKWTIKPKAPLDFLNNFPEYSSLVIQLLYNRGLDNQKKIDEFFNADYNEDLHDPFLLKGMKRAVERINQALKKKEKIFIYGDFDCDGISATVILSETLKKLGAESLGVYIPDREKENHGLNEGAIDYIHKNNGKLIITVDCGSSDKEEIARFKKLGLDIIITDHHQMPEEASAADILINPWQKGDKYPFKLLSGAGVAYKLACALIRENKIEPSLEKWLLDLVALATVADVMPIIGENRTLVKYGLGVLAQTKRIGLLELMKAAGVKPSVIHNSVDGEAPTTNLNTYTLGFVLGPRINSASRLDHADAAFRLFVTDNQEEAIEIARALNIKNTERQNLVDKILQEAEKKIDLNEKFVFLGDVSWPVGVIGLVAGKISDKYHRPSFIYNVNHEIIRGSARSIPKFDVGGALTKCERYLIEHGGHRGAAGGSAALDKVDLFKRCLGEIVEKETKEEDLISELLVDAEISWADLNWQNYDLIQNFEPYGPANEEPVFLLKNNVVSDLRTVGNNGKHLKMTLAPLVCEEKRICRAIGFGLSDWEKKIKPGDIVDVVFKMLIDEWTGERELQMKVVDMRVADVSLSRISHK